MMKKKALTENKIPDIPSAEQLRAEADRLKMKKRFSALLRSTIGSLVVAAAAIFLLSELLFPVLKVTGSGMSPTLTSGETVLCSRYSKIKNGDIIAFYHNKKILIKRVIGVEGDVIDLKDDGTVLRNGVPLDEPYINKKAIGECDTEFPITIEKDRYFVLGDNRAFSIDSRSSQIGPVAAENIIGKIYFRILPFKQLGAVD